MRISSHQLYLSLLLAAGLAVSSGCSISWCLPPIHPHAIRSKCKENVIACAPCYGYNSTCWSAWPDQCPSCPPPPGPAIVIAPGSEMVPVPEQQPTPPMMSPELAPAATPAEPAAPKPDSAKKQKSSRRKQVAEKAQASTEGKSAWQWINPFSRTVVKKAPAVVKPELPGEPTIELDAITPAAENQVVNYVGAPPLPSETAPQVKGPRLPVSPEIARSEVKRPQSETAPPVPEVAKQPATSPTADVPQPTGDCKLRIVPTSLDETEPPADASVRLTLRGNQTAPGEAATVRIVR